MKKLTDREKEVLKYILNGYTNKEIAQELHISVDTAKAHVSSILYKMNVEDRLGIFKKLFSENIDKYIKELNK